MIATPVTFQTSCAVALRQMREDDVWAFYECLHQVGGGLPRPDSVDAARRLIADLHHRRHQGSCISLVIADGHDDYLGHILIDRNPPPNHGHASIGIWLDPRHHGKGFGRAALGQAVALSFARDRHLHRLDAICLPDNAAIRRALAAVGFHCTALLPAQQEVDGRFADMELWIVRRPGDGDQPMPSNRIELR